MTTEPVIHMWAVYVHGRDILTEALRRFDNRYALGYMLTGSFFI